MSADPSSPIPFKVSIPDEDVVRMMRLIKETKLPDQPFLSDASWDYGLDLKWLKEMRDVWVNDFDWKEVEKDMNAFEHFHVPIEGVNLHFIYQRSPRADAVPILLSHGWPGSFWEFHRIIELLTNPPADEPAFHVVIPSLPGFGFSSPPIKQGWTMGDNARIFDHLMTGVLGHSSYMAQGGDWGSFVTRILGSDAFPACKLINLNMLNGPPTIGALLTLPFFLLPTSWRQWLYRHIYSEEELRDLSRSVHFVKTGLGYLLENQTRPLTIGYALYDSPVGLLAWIGEKYKEHVDPEIFPDRIHDMLAIISLYYLSGSFPTSNLPYKENAIFGQKHVITKPYGLSQFPYDIFINPLPWLKATSPNLVFVRRHVWTFRCPRSSGVASWGLARNGCTKPVPHFVFLIYSASR
ncbi:unnamed protein product [Somion occarium]|uniref:Epoxide hydrolase N-terminal domain-containing protein n=1 Tax=Somion occarium TaxID=3059160 RepID=A0ABP1D6F3_9APHY